MSARYHVNPETLDASLCRARPGKCPFRTDDGAEREHYSSLQEAQSAAEGMAAVRYGVSVPSPLRKAPKSHGRIRNIGAKFVAVSGIMAAAFSMAGCSDISASSSPVSSSDVSSIIQEAQDAASQYLNDAQSASSSGESRQTADGEVLFQGKSLKPSRSEVERARQELSQLSEVPESVAGTYNRKEMFGYFASGTVGRIEHRDIPSGSFKNGKDTSRAISGSFIDPYTGQRVDVVEGSKTDTDVDHIVPLKEVYESENPYSPLTNEQRHEIANDPANLQIVGSAVNRSKGDKDASEYLPSYEPSQCVYSIAVITVKSSYRLTVDGAESQALSNVLSTKCETSD